MDVEELHRPAIEVTALADAVHDLLQLAYGARGALADITWLKLDLGEQGMSLHGELYAQNGKVLIAFTLPHVPIPPSSGQESEDDPREIPF